MGKASQQEQAASGLQAAAELAFLSKAGVPWDIATSGKIESARPALEALAVDPGVRVITRDRVEYAKTAPTCSWMLLGGWGRLPGSVPRPFAYAGGS